MTRDGSAGPHRGCWWSRPDLTHHSSQLAYPVVQAAPTAISHPMKRWSRVSAVSPTTTPAARVTRVASRSRGGSRRRCHAGLVTSTACPSGTVSGWRSIISHRGGWLGHHVAVHHDKAAHDRGQRRYDGLHAKAVSTGFPEEADACRAKAEQLRAKYGL